MAVESDTMRTSADGSDGKSLHNEIFQSDTRLHTKEDMILRRNVGKESTNTDRVKELDDSVLGVCDTVVKESCSGESDVVEVFDAVSAKFLSTTTTEGNTDGTFVLEVNNTVRTNVTNHAINTVAFVTELALGGFIDDFLYDSGNAVDITMSGSDLFVPNGLVGVRKKNSGTSLADCTENTKRCLKQSRMENRKSKLDVTNMAATLF